MLPVQAPCDRAPARLAAAGALLGALLSVACIVDVDGVRDVVYPCEGATQSSCAEDHACFTALDGNFCAPVCDYDPVTATGSGCETGQVCTDQDLCVDTCDTESGCREGLSCVLSGNSGYCETAFTCRSSLDCRVSFAAGFTGHPESVCISEAFPEGNSCIFRCIDAADCPPEYQCVGQLPGSTGTCALPCTPTDGCPPTYSCVDGTGLDLDGHCIPGFALAECASHVNCLLGSCVPVFSDADRLCTEECETNGDCAGLGTAITGEFYCQEALASSTGSACFPWGMSCGDTAADVCSPTYRGTFCATAFFGSAAPRGCMQACPALTCGINDNLTPDCNCASDEICYFSVPAELGICLAPCLSPSACATAGWGCLKPSGAGPADVGGCAPGTLFVRCDTAEECLPVPGMQCLDVAGTQVCMFPCTGDTDCDQFEALSMEQDVYACNAMIGDYCWPAG